MKMLLYQTWIGMAWSGNWIFPWYFPLFWALPVVFFVFVWFLLWRFVFRRRNWSGYCCHIEGLPDGSYIEILKRRLAEGDIDEVQYDRLVRKLGEGRKVE